jgi:hypothetical protein
MVCAALAAGCGLAGLSPSASLAGRCQQGIDMFQQNRCGNVIATASDRPVVQAEYQSFQRECTDTASQSRLEQLGACVAKYHQAEDTKRDEHDAIRAKYERETEAVKADPDYMPTLEAWALARDEAIVAEEAWIADERSSSSPHYRIFEAKKKRLEELNEEMRQLLTKHGVDPKYASVLGLW